MWHDSSRCKQSAADRPRRNLCAWTLLAGLLLFAALEGPFLAGRVYTYDDLGSFHIPARAFYAGQLARGEAFDWMPQLFGGFYLSGEGQAGTYHPLHLVLYRFLPINAALAWEFLAGYPLMFIGTYLFLRRRLDGRHGAVFGGLVFTFSGFNLLHFIHPNAIAIVAHIPWLLWAIDVAVIDRGSRKAVAAEALIALLTASQILLGYPQYVWFSLLAESGYTLFLVRNVAQASSLYFEKTGRMPVLLVWRLPAAKIGGLMIGGIQLLPTVDALAHSARHSADAAFVNLGSLHALNLVQLIGPYLFAGRAYGGNTHEFGLYIGAVPLLLIVWIRYHWSDLGRMRTLATAAVVLGVVGFLLSLGEVGQLYRLQRFLPLVGSFRCPCRYLVLCHLATSVLAAIGLILLVRRNESGQETPWAELKPLWIVAAAAVLATAVGLALQGNPHVASPGAVLIGPLLICSAAVLMTLAARGSRAALVGLVLFTAVDLGAYGLSYAVYPYSKTLDTYASQVTAPPAGPRGRVLADLIPFDRPMPHTGNGMTILGWHRVDGYAGLEPARQLDYGRLAALRVAGVHWVKNSPTTATIEGLVSYNEDWFEVPRPLTGVRLLTESCQSNDPGRDIERVSIESTALVERQLDLPAGASGTVSIVSDRPGRLQVTTACPADRLLFVAQSYHPGWQARIDGVPGSVFRANGDFLGCLVPPGDHDVVLEFRPKSRRLGLVLSCIGLTLVSAFFTGRMIRPGGLPNKGMVQKGVRYRCRNGPRGASHNGT